MTRSAESRHCDQEPLDGADQIGVEESLQHFQRLFLNKHAVDDIRARHGAIDAIEPRKIFWKLFDETNALFWQLSKAHQISHVKSTQELDLAVEIQPISDAEKVSIRTPI